MTIAPIQSAATNIAIAATEFLVLGPFRAGQIIDSLVLVIGSNTLGSVRIAAAVVRSPDPTLANLDSGVTLIKSGSTQIGNKPTFLLYTGNTTTTTITLPVKTRVTSTPMYLIVAMFNVTSGNVSVLASSGEVTPELFFGTGGGGFIEPPSPPGPPGSPTPPAFIVPPSSGGLAGSTTGSGPTAGRPPPNPSTG